MKRGFVVVIVCLLTFVLFATLFGFDYTGMAMVYVQQSGNVVNYRVDGAGDMVQCLDAEPANDIFKKGSCHTQMKTSNNLYGLSFTDACKSKTEVVDYYCSASMLCTEVIGNCPGNYVCEDGKCMEEFKPYKYFDIRDLGKRFSRLFYKIY